MNQNKLILWIIWGGILSSILIFSSFLGASDPKETEFGVFPLMMLLGPLSASVFVRWALLPRVNNIQAQLTLFIIGSAMAESLTFFGVFLFPYFQDYFVAIAIIAIIQYLPALIRNVDSETA